MSRKYATQLRLELKTSRLYQWLVVSSSLLAFCAILLIEPLFPYLQIFLVLFLVAHAFVSWQQNRPVLLQLRQDGRWGLTDHKGAMVARLSRKSMITRFFCVLVFRLPDNRLRRVPVFSDSVDPESFRRLRVKLRVEGFDADHDKIAR